MAWLAWPQDRAGLGWLGWAGLGCIMIPVFFLFLSFWGAVLGLMGISHQLPWEKCGL